jgi:hypothetical protein
MKQFSELGLQKNTDKYIGEKISIDRVLNVKIVIHKYKIEASTHPKAKPGEMCLHLQITFNGEKRVIFTGAKELMRLLSNTNKETDFPFETTIIKVDRSFDFI